MTPRKLALLLVALPLLVAATWVAQPFPDPFLTPPAPLATLTVSKIGSGSGTVSGTGIDCGSDCTQTFNRGVQITLTATPTGTAIFAGWAGACTGTGSCVVTLAGSQSVTATFTAPVVGTREVAATTLSSQGKLVCQRRLSTTSWVNTNDNTYSFRAYREADYNLADSTICGAVGIGNYRVVWANSNTPPVVATGLNGRPAYELSLNPHGHTFIENDDRVSDLQATTGRWGFRLYWYHSDAYSCWRAKYIQISGLGYWTSSGPGGTSQFIVWDLTGQAHPGGDLRAMSNKWHRIEGYYDRWNSPTSHVLYIKNITDNLAETSLTINNPAWFPTWNDTPHFYSDRAGTEQWYDGKSCTMRFMYLIWAKNLGATERIPTACELEGGC